MNPAYEALAGYTQEELIGQKTNVVKSGQTPRASVNEMWEHLRHRG